MRYLEQSFLWVPGLGVDGKASMCIFAVRWKGHRR